MTASGETVNMNEPCAFALKAMLERNRTIHRLALQGFRWDDEQALLWVCAGIRGAGRSLGVLELLQIVATPSRIREAVGASLEMPPDAAIPFDEETSYRSKLDEEASTASKNLLAAIAAMIHLKRLCLISCELSDVSLSSSLNEKLLDIAPKSADLAQLSSVKKASQQSKLEELRLVECELNGSSVHTLHQACTNNPFLRILDVRSNQLEDYSCHALAEILITAKSLTKLILEDNNIGDDGIFTLCGRAFTSTHLKHLSLKDNKFGPNGVILLARALKTNQCLEELDLSFNFVGDDGGTALGSMLQSNTALRDLVLENTSVDGRGVMGLCRGVQKNCFLQKLNLSGNSFGLTGIQALSTLLGMQRGLNCGSSLSSLRLASCHLGDAGVASLANALEGNTVLEEIILPFNRFGDGGAIAIGQSLPKWKGLVSLQIQFNIFSEKGFEKIVQGLSQNFYLKFMYLLNAGPSNRRIEVLFQVMEHWIRLNRAGRRVLNEKTLASALWPKLLVNAGRSYNYNGIFFLLRARPDIIPLR